MQDNSQKRGLGALLQKTSAGESEISPPGGAITISSLPVDKIQPNPNQPRRSFDDEALSELSDSIKARGLIQPIVVRELSPGEIKGEARYEIIAGERRWRASQRAGLKEIPGYVKPVSKASEVLLLSLIENIQRDDLNPIEEAKAYKMIKELHQMTQEKISNAVGKSRAHVANMLRILDLPVSIVDSIRSGKLSVGHAKVLLGIPDQKLQMLIAAKCQADGLSVRELEAYASGDENFKSKGLPQRSRKNLAPIKPPHLQEIESKLCQHFGTKVKVVEGTRKGKIAIEFYSVADFDRITKLMGLAQP